jgi:hypothetical protein
MRYYRALKDLSNGYRRYELAPASAFKPDKIAVLLQAGAIGEVTGPPLSKLPGWKVRAEKLAPLEIVCVHEFLAGDVAQMAEVMNVKEVTIEKWQSEVVKWLQPIPATALQAARR